MPAKSTVRDSNSPCNVTCNKRFREKRNKSPSEIVFGFFWIFLNFNKISYLPSAPVLLKTLDRFCCESISSDSHLLTRDLPVPKSFPSESLPSQCLFLHMIDTDITLAPNYMKLDLARSSDCAAA